VNKLRILTIFCTSIFQISVLMFIVWVGIGFQFGIMILVYTKDVSFRVLFSRAGMVRLNIGTCCNS